MWYEYVGLLGCALFWVWAVCACKPGPCRWLMVLLIGALIVSATCNMLWPPHVNVHRAGYEQCVYQEDFGTHMMCTSPSGDGVVWVEMTDSELRRATNLLIKGNM